MATWRPPIESQTGMKIYVGGVTAGGVDFAKVLSDKLPLFIGVVVLLSALLLLIVFRSLVIPLQAAAMNLLSISAALGVIVAIFQWGWFGSVIGVQQGPIESFIPVMLFAIVFGLSMDYEVFLISRMHERWTQTHDHHKAVAEGLALTGRVVTAAAAIMVCVFLSFMLLNGRVIKEFGLSLASAVFLDALVVRCLLLPAVLHIVGERTWWIPAWLDRILPRVNIEGTPLPAADPGDAARTGATHPAGRAAPGAGGRRRRGSRGLSAPLGRRARLALRYCAVATVVLLSCAAPRASAMGAVASPAPRASAARGAAPAQSLRAGSVLLVFAAPSANPYRGRGAEDGS